MEQQPSRRKFIADSAKTTIALGVGSMIGSSVLASCSGAKKMQASSKFSTPFDQQPLAYAYTSLEPYIDAKTMEIHYTKHAAAYAKNLKEAAAAEGVDSNQPLEVVLSRISKYSMKMRNNGGGHYNHELFWKSMKPKGEGTPSGKLLADLETQFNSFSNFKTVFGEAAKTRFGSGWAWLIVTPEKNLAITSTPNQDNPLMDVADKKGIPIIGLDVWEHAYYLKYQNKRAEYVDNWWNVVNWAYVQQRYETAIS